MSSDETQHWTLRTTLALLAIFGFAITYQALVGYEPGADAGSHTQGTEHYLFAPTGSSPLLIFGLTALLLYARNRHLRACLGTPGPAAPGVIALVASTVLAGWGHYMSSPDLLIPAIALLLVGAASLLGGAPAIRLVAPLAFFMLLAVTPPAVVVNQLIFPLQTVTARISTLLLNAIGVGAVVLGDMILTKDQAFQVIETCSGWRSTQTLVMSAFVYGEMFYLGRTRYLSLIAASIPLGFLLNQVRVVSIVLNPLSRFAEVHEIQGILFLVIGVLALASVDRLLARVIGNPGPPSWAHHAPIAGLRRAPLGRLAGVAAALVVSALVTRVVAPWNAERESLIALSRLPPKLAGLQAAGLGLDRQYLGSINPDEWVFRSYAPADATPKEREEAGVRVFIAGNKRTSRNRSLLSPKTMLPGPSTEILVHEQTDLAGVPTPIDVLRVRYRTEERIVVHWRYGVSSFANEAWRAWAGLDRSQFRRPGRAVAVRLDITLPDQADHRAVERTRERLLSVASETARFLADATAPPSVALR